MAGREKLFVSGAWSARTQLRNCAMALWERGYTIVGRWFDAPHGARVDVENLIGFDAVRDCDAVVAIATDPHYPYQGTLVEIGMAVALRKPVVALVPRGRGGAVGTCIYARASQSGVTLVESWLGVEAALAQMRAPIPSAQ